MFAVLPFSINMLQYTWHLHCCWLIARSSKAATKLHSELDIDYMLYLSSAGSALNAPFSCAPMHPYALWNWKLSVPLHSCHQNLKHLLHLMVKIIHTDSWPSRLICTEKPSLSIVNVRYNQRSERWTKQFALRLGLGSDESFIKTLMLLRKYDCGAMKYTPKSESTGATETLI